MKKKKLFVLLPLVALILSSCGYSITPWDAPEDDDEALGQYTPSDEDEGAIQGASYSVSITNGEDLSLLKEGESAVVAVLLTTTSIEGEVSTQVADASDVTITSLNPDIVSVEGLRITALKEGYTSIYATWTKRAQISVPVGIQVQSEYVTPSDPEEPEPDVIDYSVEITNTSEISSLVEGDSATLSVSLITTTNGVPSAVAATTSDVTLSSSDTSVVSVSGLTITALSKGTSNITATWTERSVTSESVTVSVSEAPSAGEEPEPEPEPEPTPDPVISYRVEIANADEIREIQTGDERLVQVTIYKLSDGVEVSGDGYPLTGTSDNVTLISSEPDYLSVEGLTITALAAKENINLSALWGDYMSSPVPVTVTAALEPEPEPEPEPVYTYELTVNNAEALLSLGVGYGYETDNEVELDITLTTFIDGEFAYAQKADDTITDLEVISHNSDVVTTSGLTVIPVEEGEAAIEIKWSGHQLNGDPLYSGDDEIDGLSYWLNASVTRYEEYVEPEPEDVYIESIDFSEDLYEFVYGETDPIDLDILIEPENATYPDSYAITFENDSIAKINCEGKLEALAIGETTMFVTATDQDTSTAPCGEATVKVVAKTNPVLSFSTNLNSIAIDVGDSITVGYASADGTNNPDVIVTANPADADNLAFSLTVDSQDEFISVSARDDTCGLNTYTLTATNVTDAGLAIHSYTITISSDDGNSVATKDFTLSINTELSKTNPVTRISLSKPVVTLTNDGSFTIGNDDNADVVVSVNEEAYENGWYIADYDTTLLNLSFDDESKLMTFTALEPDNNETISTVITIISQGVPYREAYLTVYIQRAEEYLNNLVVNTSEVSMLTNQTIVLGQDEEYDDFSVSIYNQYNEVVEGALWSATINSDASGIGVLDSVARVDGSVDRLSITTGSRPGTGVIAISSDDDPTLSQDITVTVSQQYYEVEQISCSLTSIGLTYDKESSPEGSSAYIQDSAVTYWSSKGPVGTEYEGFELVYSGSYLAIGEDGRTITALLPTGEEGVDVTVRSTSNTSVTTSINVVVNDITDYGVKTLSLVDGSNNDVEDVTITVSGDADNSEVTLESLGVYVSISPDYATNKDYTITSTNPSLVYVDSNNNITAKASKDGGTATLYVVAADTTYGAQDSLKVTVNTTYVKADTINVAGYSSTLTTGDTFDFDSSASVQITNSGTSTPTDASYTITSNNESVISVNGHEITAEGAGSATLTFTTADGAATEIVIEVSDPRTHASNVTIYFALTDDSGNYYTNPEYADIYLAGAFADGTNWDTQAQLTSTTTYNNHTYYGVTLDSVILDTEIEYRICFEYTGDPFNWNHQSDLLKLTVSSDTADGATLYYDAKTGDPANIIVDQTGTEQFTVTIGFKNSGNGGSSNTIYIYGDLEGWTTGSTQGTACTAVSGNTSYDQYMTVDWDRYTNFKFIFGSSSSGVWYSWGAIGNSSGTLGWDSSHAYSWYSDPEWGFDLSQYASSSSLDSYTNLTIIFTLNFGNISAASTTSNLVTNISISWS